MIDLHSLGPLVQTYGLAVFFPLAVIEGPIVTVIAAWLARLGYLDVFAVYAVAVLADLVGDALFYWLGRLAPRLSPRWRHRLHLDDNRLGRLEEHFRAKGPRTLVLGKITHSVGFAVLIAAGMSRMPFGAFLWYNFLATLPKVLIFVALGYAFGAAYATIDIVLFRVSVVTLAAIMLAALIWYLARRRRQHDV